MCEKMDNADLDPRRVNPGDIEALMHAIRKINGEKIISLDYLGEIILFKMDEFGLIGFDNIDEALFRTNIEKAMYLVGGMIIRSFTETLDKDLPKYNISGAVFNDNHWHGLGAEGIKALYRLYIHAVTQQALPDSRNFILARFPRENNVVFVDFP